jgi:protein-S-isoprenylcysteine O-methyltransferase Ste14
MIMKPDIQPGLGVFRKSLIEKLKLLIIFIFLGALIYWSHPKMPDFAIGLVLVVLGTLIRIWAGGHLTRDQRLTTSGPYEYSRNPFYLGRFLLIIGFAVMAGLSNVYVWIILIAALLIFFLMYMPRKEQREGGRLRELFGPDYEQWKANVPMLFPRLTPYKMNPKPWSRELYMGNTAEFRGNKEIWTTLAIIGIVGLFYWRMATLHSPQLNNNDKVNATTSERL